MYTASASLPPFTRAGCWLPRSLLLLPAYWAVLGGRFSALCLRDDDTDNNIGKIVTRSQCPP